tara:strand:- start:1553 stop:2278 length:726 start_codon:yes stop_codon:yes gene_type:complete
MFKDRSILAVVPARGGSKGIPLKNLRELCGVSLVGITGRVIQQLSWIDRAVVSTDDDRIAEAAEAEGIDAPFRRPESLSGDRIGDWDVLKQALEEMEAQDDRRYDIVLMLQPTSPLRTPQQVEACVRKLMDGNFDAVWTVSETDSKGHPLKQLVVSANGEMDYYDPRGAEIIARQQLQPVYHRNGVAYAITRDCLLNHGSIKGNRSGALVVDEPLANIDTEADLEWAEIVAGKLQLEWLRP